MVIYFFTGLSHLCEIIFAVLISSSQIPLSTLIQKLCMCRALKNMYTKQFNFFVSEGILTLEIESTTLHVNLEDVSTMEINFNQLRYVLKTGGFRRVSFPYNLNQEEFTTLCAIARPFRSSSFKRNNPQHIKRSTRFD